MKKNIKTSGSLFTTLLAVAFIVLKLCHVINWSWWWVLTPFWAPIALAVVTLIIASIITIFENRG